jgi:hypothetical protein
VSLEQAAPRKYSNVSKRWVTGVSYLFTLRQSLVNVQRDLASNLAFEAGYGPTSTAIASNYTAGSATSRSKPVTAQPGGLPKIKL